MKIQLDFFFLLLSLSLSFSTRQRMTSHHSSDEDDVSSHLLDMSHVALGPDDHDEWLYSPPTKAGDEGSRPTRLPHKDDVIVDMFADTNGTMATTVTGEGAAPQEDLSKEDW